MERENYNLLKQSYDFFNYLMLQFEKTVELQSATYNLLNEIGKFTKATRVQLLKYENGFYNLNEEWILNGQFKTDIYPLKSHPEWIDNLKENKKMFVENVNILPNSLKNDVISMNSTNVKSMYLLPIFDEMNIEALLVICDPDQEKIQCMDLIHELLSNWLGFRLIKNDTHFQYILSGLGQDYTAAYMINMDTSEFEVIINQGTNNSAKESKKISWTDYLCSYANKYCVESSCEAMKHELGVETLKTRLEVENDYHFTFETTPNDIGQTTFQAHAVKRGRYAVVGFRCVDEILKKEREYRESLNKAYLLAQQQLDVITSAIPGGIKISYDDPEYSFKYVSEQYAAMLGYDSVDEFLQASHGSILGIAHPDDIETGVAAALKQYETANYYAITYRMRCKDGSYKYIEDHGHKVIKEDGTIEHWNLILDKNELVETTIALETEKKANLAKTDFLSRMSHDIRTPLNGIIGLLDIGAKHPNDLNLINLNRKKARVAADHLLSLINDILELNKLQDESVSLNQEVFDMKKLVDQVTIITEMKAKEDNIQLNLHLPPDDKPCPLVYGSPLHVQQVLINVITNAIKYNKPGGSVDFYLKPEPKGKEYRTYSIQVKDTGIGMSEEFLKTIYEPFTQAAQDARSVYQGTGLGMPIVKNLCQRMGADLQITSKEGVGTTVDIVLTLKLANKDTDCTQNPKKDIHPDLTNVKVLLVEDNDLNREIARFILEDEGMDVTEAINGKDAVKLASQNAFDIILMDVLMPVMDGYEAAKEIRTLDKDVPIFALTANAFKQDVDKAKAAGMNEHISKPLDSKLLIDKIGEYINKNKS